VTGRGASSGADTRRVDAPLDGVHNRQDAYIGVDVGGTHTDVVAVVGGRPERGKALTTYDDFARGVLDAVHVAAERHGLTVEELLARTRMFVNGTTVVTNAITTLTGSDVGVLVTAGFRDTFRLAGGPRIAAFDDHLQVNAPDIVRREAIIEVDERIDWAGVELVALDVDQVRAGARRLVDELGVDALAVCFVGSFLDPSHELQAARAIRELYPDVFVTPSHEVFPVRGENRRWTTAVLNSFVQQRAQGYLESLSARLRDAGLTGGLVFFQGLGGSIGLERAKRFPLALLGSGPAGGATGANALGRRMGARRLLLGDMGGTSFDTGIIVDNELHIEKHLQLGLLQTGVNVVDVVSVGAGGGSVAWVGERGVPQVGPRSAGSEPGPAAYGRGGTESTVTDAMVTMGFIDPERYLGGRFKLHRDLARASLEPLAQRFGWSVEAAAAAIHDLVVVNMAGAVREVSVGKGHDPREFLFLAYGGTLPLFAIQIAERLGISQVVIPDNSSVFSAAGLLAAEHVVRRDRTVAWDLSRPEHVGAVNAVAREMREGARREMQAEGFAEEAVQVRMSADFRFFGQSYELTMPLADTELSDEDAPRLAERFLAHYERTYGAGTAWKGVPAQLLTLTVTASGRHERPHMLKSSSNGAGGDALALGTRRVFLPNRREWRDVYVYADEGFSARSELAGPAIIDASDTTIYVPEGTTARRDEFMNHVLTMNGGVA
jgi:N-methylhydantoinase A